MTEREGKTLSGKFGVLIDLFYGLALATGLEYTIPKLVNPKPNEPPVLLALVILALIMGLSDWVIYHVIVVEKKYEGVVRLLLDICFPILIFVLFALSDSLPGFLVCFVVYCALTLLYSYLFQRPNGKRHTMPKRIWIPMVIYFTIGIVAEISLEKGCLDCFTTEEISRTLTLFVGVPWFWCNFSLVQTRLKEESGQE